MQDAWEVCTKFCGIIGLPGPMLYHFPNRFRIYDEKLNCRTCFCFLIADSQTSVTEVGDFASERNKKLWGIDIEINGFFGQMMELKTSDSLISCYQMTFSDNCFRPQFSKAVMHVLKSIHKVFTHMLKVPC